MYYVKDQKGYSRLTGRSRAVVIDNRDPEQRGQIQVNHPLLGETVWIYYLRSPGAFDIPSIGDIVYVECDSGHHEYPVAWGNLTKGKSSNPEIPAAFKRDVPTNRGFFTPDGHLIEFDDGIAIPELDANGSTKTTEGRGIRITTSQGAKIHMLDDNDNGERKILLEDPNGNYFVIDRENGSMDMSIDGNWNAVATGEAKVVAGSKATVDAPDTEVTGTATVQGDTTLNANLNVTGTSTLAGGTPLLLATAQFVGTGNLGVPVISTIMSGQATKVTGS